MSATERIRAMLDERGVEWRGGLPTETMVEADGLDLLYVALPDGRVRAFIRNHITPEQAIEATLGRGECEKLPSDGITRCFVRRYGYEREFGYWKCSACGCECFEGARYCMGCGRKVRA